LLFRKVYKLINSIIIVTNEEVVLSEIDKFMNEVTDRIFQLSQENLITEGKVDTGNLLKTGNVNRRFLEKEIVYPAPYADTIEFGRNPGQMPPPEALNNWVRRKLGVKNEKEAKRVSWAIAMAIKQRGIQPTPFLQNAISQAKTEFGI